MRAREMEIYAAMIEYMDWQIGRLLERVEMQPGDRDTLVIFVSDNGPEGNAIDRIGQNGEWIAATFDNRPENMGRQNSYLYTGPGWAQASARPFHLYKSFIAEGGLRAPAIMLHSGIDGTADLDAMVTVRDIPATILDAAGIPHPGTRYGNRDILAMEGVSALPLLRGETDSIHAGEPLGWELYGNRALIRDNWKAMLLWPPYGNGQWSLYDIAADPGETNDLGEQHPELLDELAEAWHEYADRNGIYLFEEDNGYGRY